MTQWAGSANSCVNPFIYCFFSNKFRAGFKQLFAAGCCCCCRRRCSSEDGWTRQWNATVGGGSGAEHTAAVAAAATGGRRDTAAAAAAADDDDDTHTHAASRRGDDGRAVRRVTVNRLIISQFTPPDYRLAPASGDANTLDYCRVTAKLPPTVADSIRTARRDATPHYGRDESCDAAGGVN